MTQESKLREALDRMLPIFEHCLRDRAFTADKAGQVDADMQVIAQAALQTAQERRPMTVKKVLDMAIDGVFHGSCVEIVRAIEAHHNIRPAGEGV